MSGLLPQNDGVRCQETFGSGNVLPDCGDDFWVPIHHMSKCTNCIHWLVLLCMYYTLIKLLETFK